VEVCKSLSEAYQAVASQLLLAAQRLISVAPQSLSAIQESQSALPPTASVLPAALQSVATSCVAAKLRKLWWLWIRKIEHGSQKLPLGRVGIVVHGGHHHYHIKCGNDTNKQMNVDREEQGESPSSESDIDEVGQFNDAALCSLDDSIACGICISQRQFWGGLLWLLVEAKVLLLLGGTACESSVITISAAKHRQWKEDNNNRIKDDV